ncbi:MAG: hypothetical protein AB7G52_08155 [Arcobacter sp.]
MEKYKIDSIIDSFFIETINNDKRIKILNVISIINDINNISNIVSNFDISKLESELIEIILLEDEEINNKVAKIDIKLKNEIIEYLKRLGIILKDDIYFFQLEDILFSIYTIYTIDTDNAEYLVSLLNNDEVDDEVMLLTDILYEYTTMSSFELYDLIEDIMDNVLSNMALYLNNIIKNKVIILDKKLVNDIEKLISIDNYFSETFFIKYIMQNDYTYVNLDMNIDSLYNNSERCVNNIQLLPYEIVTVLYLSIDSKLDILNSYKESINLSNISFLSNDKSKAEVIDNFILELINKVNRG